MELKEKRRTDYGDSFWKYFVSLSNTKYLFKTDDAEYVIQELNLRNDAELCKIFHAGGELSFRIFQMLNQIRRGNK